MKPPFVIHVNEMHEYPDAVYIGRAVPRRGLKGSVWRNRYKIDSTTSRAQAVDFYRDEIRVMLRRHPDKFDMKELTGKPIACWCRYSHEERTEDNTCHGDVIVELWQEIHGAEVTTDAGPRGTERSEG